MLNLVDEDRDVRREASHPGEAELARFVRGELKGPDLRRIVRHLLAGCPVCQPVTRRLWGLGDEGWSQR